MDSNGQVIVEPKYEAIGEFKKYGYSIMQRNGMVGLLNQQGQEVVLPQYEDIKVLDSLLIAVMDLEEWMVINLKGQVILEKGYERVQVWDGGFSRIPQRKEMGSCQSRRSNYLFSKIR